MASNELEAQLLEIGNQLLEPPSTVEELLPLLDRIERCLTKVGQSPNKSMQAALSPSQKALVAEQLLRHSDPHVKVSVASCITEITRITAPDAPYDDDPMKEAFQLIVSTFENLQNKPSRSYTKTTYILETVARVRSCELMLDLECDELIVEMFQHFLKAIRGYHPVSVISSMENIITLVIEECEDVSCQLLAPLLASVKNVEEEVETHGIALADYSKVVASICSESAGDTEKNGVHDDKDMGGYNLRGRKKKDVDLNMFDRISGLPDEILTSILSLLPLREAQATRILSRRWQHVWPYCTTLNFDAGRQLITFGKLQFDWERELVLRMYVDWVDSVLKQHKAPNIERFRVAFGHGPRSCIDDWIQFAMRKGVQILEMDLSAILHPRGLHYKLSNKVLGIREFSSFKALCSEYIGFKFHKVLDFNCVDVDQGILEYFIYNCPVLERVAVCDSSLMVNLRVVGQSIALKYLTIQQCLNLKSIEICEANLISFTYGGDLEKLLLRNLPLLVEISLSGMTRITGWSAKIDFSYLSCCLSQLEILKINYIILWGETDPVIPSLPNLKCLELAFDEDNNYALLHIAFFIKQTPCLHTLVMKFRSWWCPKNPFAKKRAARYSHDCLKVVKFLEYSGLSRQIELVKYLMKTASNLEKIIFDPVNRQYSGVHRLLFPHIVEMEELSRAEAHQLKEKLPATLDVVCQ